MEQETIDQVVQDLVQKYEPVVATPLKHGAVAPVLDEETYNTLRGMLNSNDEGNHKMAQLILNTCDIGKSIYWIWRLSTRYCHNMVNLRTKASRSFRDKSSLFYIASCGDTRFAKWLVSKKPEWMTVEIYQRLEETIVRDVASQSKNEFYDVEVKVKDKYKHLALTTTPIKIKKDDE
jgi:hypothetical protein